MRVINDPFLTEWELEMLAESPHAEGAGDVMFMLADGTRLYVNDVLVDTISPVGANKGVISMEFSHSGELLHIPNVVGWSVNYRF